MRTTLDIDDDLLAAAKDLAKREKCSAGEVVSSLLRHALTGRELVQVSPRRGAAKAVAGFVPFSARPGVVTTNAQVDALREAEGV